MHRSFIPAWVFVLVLLLVIVGSKWYIGYDYDKSMEFAAAAQSLSLYGADAAQGRPLSAAERDSVLRQLAALEMDEGISGSPDKADGQLYLSFDGEKTLVITPGQPLCLESRFFSYVFADGEKSRLLQEELEKLAGSAGIEPFMQPRPQAAPAQEEAPQESGGSELPQGQGQAPLLQPQLPGQSGAPAPSGG